MKNIKEIRIEDIKGLWGNSRYRIKIDQDTHRIIVHELSKNPFVDEQIKMEYLQDEKNPKYYNTMQISNNVNLYSINGIENGELYFNFGKGCQLMNKIY